MRVPPRDGDGGGRPAAAAAAPRDVAAAGRAAAHLRGRHGRPVAAVGAAERGAGAQAAAVPVGPGGAAGAGRGAAGLRAAAPGRGAGPVLRRLPLQAELRHPRLQPPERAGRSALRAVDRAGAVLGPDVGGSDLLLPAVGRVRKAARRPLLPGQGGAAAGEGRREQELLIFLLVVPEAVPRDTKLVSESLSSHFKHSCVPVLLLCSHRSYTI